MKIRLARTILREELAQNSINKYSVKQYCQASGVGRASFYSTYNGMLDLFCNTLQFEIRKHFQNYSDCNSRKLVYALLKEIGDHRIYYTNIYHLTNKNTSKVHICHQINHAFFTEMQKHLQNSNCSNKQIQSMTNIIFSRVVSWVAHNCKEKVLDVYVDLEYVLPSN